MSFFGWRSPLHPSPFTLAPVSIRSPLLECPLQFAEMPHLDYPSLLQAIYFWAKQEAD
jgi:hypothetical protein